MRKMTHIDALSLLLMYIMSYHVKVLMQLQRLTVSQKSHVHGCNCDYITPSSLGYNVRTLLQRGQRFLSNRAIQQSNHFMISTIFNFQLPMIQLYIWTRTNILSLFAVCNSCVMLSYQCASTISYGTTIRKYLIFVVVIRPISMEVSQQYHGY